MAEKERNDLAGYSGRELALEVFNRYMREDRYTGAFAWGEDGDIDRLEVKKKDWLPPCNGNCACGGGGEPPKEER